MKRQLRVAAYCRVSTEEEEQQSSYEAQCTYYTDKIMTNPEWTMAGIFADEGITGTSTKKRDDFNRMIRRCKAKKIDLILTKSISRFARNTLDTINYTRMLRAMGIGVIFEKENINTPQLSAGSCSMRFRRKQSAGLRQRALPRSPPQEGPAIQANMPCQNGLYAGSAVPYTEGVPGTEKSKNGSSGDALADWTMGKNTVITPPRWMRSLFKKQLWRH